MATNYVLIDYENVHPSNLEVLGQHPFNIIVFVGAAQAKIPFDLAAAMQPLGKTAQYIKIAGTGKNATAVEYDSEEPGAAQIHQDQQRQRVLPITALTLVGKLEPPAAFS